jgi:Zn-dependent protease
MKSFVVGIFWGIPIKIHWTFSLLFGLLMIYGWFTGTETSTLLAVALFIIVLFVCVILHEFGHALTARRFGVETIDIIISPIGGIARLKKLPEKPMHELIVAIAGPIVNLSIAIILFIVAVIAYSHIPLPTIDNSIKFISSPFGFLALLIWLNIVLFVFNLIPAFPMDGGRILRALLSMKYGKVKGTYIASYIGRIIAIIFIGLGLFTNISLVLIGAFVFFMARSENEQIIIKSKLSGVKVVEIMNPNYTKFHLSNTLRDVYQNYIRGGEKNYLVFDSLGNVAGVLPELFIKDAFKKDQLDKNVNVYMSDNIYYIDESLTLDKLFEEMNVNGASIAIIKYGDQIQGVVDRQMLYTFIQLQVSK